MKIPSTTCPNCNALQRFPQRQRDLGDRVQIFLTCSMCRFEISLGEMSHEDAARQQRLIRRQRRSRIRPRGY